MLDDVEMVQQYYCYCIWLWCGVGCECGYYYMGTTGRRYAIVVYCVAHAFVCLVAEAAAVAAATAAAEEI